jgi:hypothetical protein
METFGELSRDADREKKHCMTLYQIAFFLTLVNTYSTIFVEVYIVFKFNTCRWIYDLARKVYHE